MLEQAFSFNTSRYPVGATMQGVWTWQEVETAVRHGTRLLELKDVWVHLGGRFIFQAWWEAVQEGRKAPGLAGMLAKVTGNALWGRFCMDNRVQGVRTIRAREGRTIASRPVRVLGGQPAAHDLAETVSGRTRARLYDVMMTAGPKLVSAHTDGIWSTQLDQPDGWRRKGLARRLDLIDPQTLRYWPIPPNPTEPWVVMAGIPATMATEAFERSWNHTQEEAV
jgi:hypothetical protein